MEISARAVLEIENYPPVAIDVTHRIIYESRGKRGGLVTIKWTYYDPAVYGDTRLVTKSERYSWNNYGQLPDCELYIGDFIVPPRIRGCGVGTITWSLVAKTAQRLGVQLYIRGSLSERDVTSFEFSDRRNGIPNEPVANLERRNAFWSKILAGGQLSRSSADGSGAFRDLLVDPIPTARGSKYRVQWA